MREATPHYFLYTDFESADVDNVPMGRWHVVLESVDGDEYFDASSSEPGTVGERLELLAVVRGLEALNQPSRVTLVTPSRYVTRGIKFGLAEWRASGWSWESFGTMVPVNNGDLWQRVDAALKFHDVSCRQWRIDQSHGDSDNKTQKKSLLEVA